MNVHFLTQVGIKDNAVTLALASRVAADRFERVYL